MSTAPSTPAWLIPGRREKIERPVVIRVSPDGEAQPADGHSDTDDKERPACGATEMFHVKHGAARWGSGRLPVGVTARTSLGVHGDLASLRPRRNADPWLGRPGGDIPAARARCGDRRTGAGFHHSPDLWSCSSTGVRTPRTAPVFPGVPFTGPADVAHILEIADRLCAEFGVGRTDCVAYGDTMSDAALFGVVSASVAVNADHHLTGLATYTNKGRGTYGRPTALCSRPGTPGSDPNGRTSRIPGVPAICPRGCSILACCDDGNCGQDRLNVRPCSAQTDQMS